MPSENVEIIRRGYEAWNRGDVDAALDLMDPDVEVQGHPQLPDPGPVRGRDAVRRWLRQLLDAWDEIAIETEELIDAGDRVVALLRFRGRGKGSGAEVESGLDAHVWTVRNGRIVSARWYQGTRDALDSVGLRR